MRGMFAYTGRILLLSALWMVAGTLLFGALNTTVRPASAAAPAPGAVSQSGPMYGPSTPMGMPAQSTSGSGSMAPGEMGPTGETPAGCAVGDSWCAYCSSYPSSGLCKTVPPSHAAAGVAAAPGTSTTTAPSAGATAASAGAGGATVAEVQSGTSGAYLVDGQGMALYTLSADTAGSSSCTGMCATVWPPLLAASGTPTAGSGVTGTLAVITRADGGKQVTDNGKPLYRFSADMKPGDTTGSNVTDEWGHWSLAKP